MIDEAVLAALAGAVEQGGDVEAALLSLRRVDPLLRGAARRRLRDAHADAALAAGSPRGAEGETHTLRLAYLMVARALPPRVSGAGSPAVREDPGALTAAYEAERAARPLSAARPRFWWPTALVTLTLLGAGAVAAVAGLRASAPAAASPAIVSPLSRPSPPARGAYAAGGVPERAPDDAAIARALGTDAPAFLIALDRRSEALRSGSSAAVAEAEAEMRRAREQSLAPDVREALGAGGAEALEALFTAATAASASAREARAKASDAFAAAVSSLDDQLAARGLGYFVDGDVLTDTGSGRRIVLVYTFRVAQVSLFTAGATTVRALHVRRLDKLNWSHTLLGFTRPTLRSAVVLLDQLDEQVLTMIAPALAEGAPVPLFEPEAPAAERAAVEARAGELTRAEYGALPDLDRAAAAKLGKLLGRRRALFAGWEKLAAARGLTLLVPAKLRLPEGFAASLAGLAPRDELEDLALVDAALDDQTRADAFATLREALASSVERHEVQHRLDALGPQPPPMPRALEALVGPAAPSDPASDDAHRLGPAGTARAELSAYLAELGRDARTPRVGLTLIARFLFDRRMHGAPECYAALTILGGLSDALGVRPKAPFVAGGSVDRQAVAEAWLALTALPEARLREAAARLWETLFSAPLPDLRKIAPGAPG